MPYPYIDPNWMQPDETLGCLIVLVLFLLLALLAHRSEQRSARQSYERARLAYSAERMRRIRNLEM